MDTWLTTQQPDQDDLPRLIGALIEMIRGADAKALIEMIRGADAKALIATAGACCQSQYKIRASSDIDAAEVRLLLPGPSAGDF